MAKIRTKHEKTNNWKQFQNAFRQYCNVETANEVIFTSKYLNFASVCLLLGELIVGLVIIHNVKYTEIDWKAYMQEVEGFINGTFDYTYLKGDTGPLVYPAGFVYLFSLFYTFTDRGTNIRLAQYIYLSLYLLLLYLVFRIYRRSKKVPGYCLVLMCVTTYRIHSLFMLRLFNDPVAVIFFYISLNLLLDDRWTLGSIFFSLGVSIKMNILLYAPALLLAYLNVLGLYDTLKQLFVCGSLQVVLGLPFLISNPYAYLKGSFDLGRVFLYRWTVNWRFLPEYIFLDKKFHIFLLVLHLACLGVFYRIFLRYLKSYGSLKYVQKEVKKQLKKANLNTNSLVQLILYPFFVTNFIGIVFSRSLHYQFYVWYYHSLPYLLWCTKFQVVTRLTLLGIVELCWNTYPSTDWSSAALLISHMTILYGLYTAGKINLK